MSNAVTPASSLQSRLEVASRKYQDLQDELSKSVEARERLESQQLETENVKKEFASLKPSNTIYKLIGPVLIPQEHSEAKSNVEKRLEFISAEMRRVETQIKELGQESERVKSEIVQIQATLQGIQQQQQQTQVPAVLSN